MTVNTGELHTRLLHTGTCVTSCIWAVTVCMLKVSADSRVGKSSEEVTTFKTQVSTRDSETKML